MSELLIVKTGALGDVLRTTSILPGLHRRYPGARVCWVTAPAAVDLVRTHPLVERVEPVDPGRAGDVAELAARLGAGSWERVLSFDDEEPLCRLAAACGSPADGTLSGAYWDGERRAYTPDVAPWFDMGLLSVHGKQEADRRKLANRESHPAIYAAMLGIEMGEPELALPDSARAAAAGFAERHGLHANGPLVGFNTGAGGRWESKKLPVDRAVALGRLLNAELGGRLSVLVLGGPDEAERNRAILDGLTAGPEPVRAVDAGTDNALLDFAALVDALALLVTSDSLALHVAVARRVPVVAFFAPTSAAEIELYGRGEKVASTAPDYCSYRADADDSTLTPERLAEAVLRHLPQGTRR